MANETSEQVEFWEVLRALFWPNPWDCFFDIWVVGGCTATALSSDTRWTKLVRLWSNRLRSCWSRRQTFAIVWYRLLQISCSILTVEKRIAAQVGIRIWDYGDTARCAGLNCSQSQMKRCQYYWIGFHSILFYLNYKFLHTFRNDMLI